MMNFGRFTVMKNRRSRESFEKTSMGKIDKKRLRARYAAP